MRAWAMMVAVLVLGCGAAHAEATQKKAFTVEGITFKLWDEESGKVVPFDKPPNPYGSNLTHDLASYSRLHQTSGTTGAPLRYLDTPRSWDQFMECWAQIFRMIGLRREDRLLSPCR